MKRIQKLVSLLCAMALVLAMGAFSAGVAESAADVCAAGDAQLALMSGMYQPLFQGALFEENCDDYWHDAAAAVVGDTMANDAVALMKASIGADIYGQEAINAYAASPESAAFCCDFIDGVHRIQIDGTQISGYDESGEVVFSHAYQCIGITYIGEEMGIEGFGGYTYESLDADAGEFTYFLFLPDTIDSTYHVEFRYGSDLDDMKLYGTGAYAYWLAAGIADYAQEDENLLRQVIALFSAENLEGMTTDETLAQREAFVGTWDAAQETLDILRSKLDLPKANMYCAFSADGVGETYVDAEGTGEFVLVNSYTYFVYDNDNDAATQSGIYIVLPEESSEIADYQMIQADGQTVLSFITQEGVASWIKRP